MNEPPPTTLSFRVTNPHSMRYGATGLALTTYTRAELEGRTVGVLERATWVILDFADGLPPEAFATDEVARV